MVKVIAHRASGVGPTENTIKGMQIALAWRVDGVEFDVHTTKDGVLVLMHDDTLERTTNGRGRIREKSLTQLKRLNAGEGEEIPTLEEAFEFLKHEKKLVLHVEIKARNIENQVLELIQEQEIENRVVISSFLPSTLKKVHELNAEMTTAYLYHYDKTATKTAQKLGCSGLHPLFTTVTPELMQVAKQEGFFVNPWVVDFPEELQRLIRLGVDGIITNNPPVLLDLIHSD
jgi:glycerophosphoryl diester phosphodiesterase